jgi:hypothetical protein
LVGGIGGAPRSLPVRKEKPAGREPAGYVDYFFIFFFFLPFVVAFAIAAGHC